MAVRKSIRKQLRNGFESIHYQSLQPELSLSDVRKPFPCSLALFDVMVHKRTIKLYCLSYFHSGCVVSFFAMKQASSQQYITIDLALKFSLRD